MRKGLLAVVLVFASFAGGAVVNGPLPGWVRDQVQTHLRAEGDGNPPVEAADGLIQINNPPPSAPGLPSAPMPPLSLDQLRARQSAPEPTSPAQTPDSIQDESTAAVESLAATTDDPKPTPPNGNGPVLARPLESPEFEFHPTPNETPEAPPALVAENFPDAPGSAPAEAVVPPSNADGADSAPATRDPALNRAAAEALDNPLGSEPAPAPAPSVSDDWSRLQQRMNELGVARFWMEGEPDGPVRFRCLVPLVGNQAVSQHFEAEGDDALQAAEAALRRVTLWRATEAEPE